MGSISSLFPFDQIDPYQQHTIPKDILVIPSLYGSNLMSNPASVWRQKSSSTSEKAISKPKDYKKIKHRDVERQRRQEMATLYKSLRSLLPLEYLKGKRSISDQMHEAVNYINHLQKRVKELNDKIDGLKRLSNPDDIKFASEFSQRNCLGDNITVKTCRTGLKVNVGTALRGGLPLSKVLSVLIQEGLSIVCCISTKVNQTLLHTIESEVNDGRSITVSELQQKLRDLVP
ncbi:transcription factor bHLH118 [Cornus florida]|uniref:transcription factor bHLH118 n=1 Tax=Cornus florida TaxID=4283 RepID=UPI00289AC495|nr:transcription factor bHLH118 [Cornus florida]